MATFSLLSSVYDPKRSYPYSIGTTSFRRFLSFSAAAKPLSANSFQAHCDASDWASALRFFSELPRGGMAFRGPDLESKSGADFLQADFKMRKKTPLKTNECPLKINGWRMYCLLKQSFFGDMLVFGGVGGDFTMQLQARFLGLWLGNEGKQSATQRDSR